MADVTPYEEGSGWSCRRRVLGQDLYVSGQATSGEAKGLIDEAVARLKARGKPKGDGPSRTTVGQAMQDMGVERLPFMKGARQEANRMNRYLRAAGLDTLKVRPFKQSDAEQATAADGGKAAKGSKERRFIVELEAPKSERAIPRGLAAHRDELATQTARVEILRGNLARMKFDKVQTYHVQEFMDAIRMTREPATQQLERAVLRSLFYYASSSWCWSQPSANPAVALKMPKVDNGRERVMSVDEERRLDEAVQSCHNDLVGPTLTLLTESAMRSSEPLQYARWGDVDWDAKELKLRDSKTSSRNVPLSPRAIEALRELARLNPGGPEDHIVSMSYEALKAAWQRACVRAGITDLNLHDLRHTAATRAALKFGNLCVVKVITGHKTMSQLQRYINVQASDVVALMHAPEPTPVAALAAAPVVASPEICPNTMVPAAPVLQQTQEAQAVEVVGNLIRVNFGQRRPVRAQSSPIGG